MYQEPRKKEMSPERRALVRHGIRFFLLALLAHTVSLIFYLLIAARIIKSELAYADSNHRGTLIFFSLLMTLLFLVMIAVSNARDGEKRRGWLLRTKEWHPTAKERFLALLPEALAETLVWLGLQLPFLIFYSFAGFDYVYTTGLEWFYAIEAGIYEITRIGILGFLLDGVLFFAVSMLLRLYYHRAWEKDRI